MPTRRKRKVSESERGHPVTKIRINGPDVQAVCECGWVSDVCTNETDARALHAIHEAKSEE